MQDKYKTRAETARRSAVKLLFAVILAALIFRYVLIPIRVYGASMQPSYREGSFNFINGLAYIAGEPRRGDVVGIMAAGRRVLFLKRIIGLPGETVSFSEGVLFIDGIEHSEPYAETASGWSMAPVTSGNDEYFVAGDNRSVPIEHHTLGRVTRGRIIGRILF